MAQATALSPDAVVAAAKGLIQAYNDKNWDRARASMTPDFVYDEVATGRTVSGRDAALDLWKGWAEAFPDSTGTIHSAHAAEHGMAVLELTWKGTHRGPLQGPKGPIAPIGRTIEVRACVIYEFAEEKARAQRHYFDMATLYRQLGVS